MNQAVVGAALVPGMPHLLAAEPAPSWKLLADAARQAGQDLRAAEPDVFVVLSTQWFTVLGHQFQVDPNPRGGHVDENWYAYDYGTLDYDLRVDVELAEAWACRAEDMGFQARRTRYDGFPVDTGTVVAGKLVDPGRSRPIALVSCNLYAAAADLGRIAEAAALAAGELGRRVAFVAVSGFSSGLIQRWIEPAEDRSRTPATTPGTAACSTCWPPAASRRSWHCASSTPERPRPTASCGRWPFWPAAAPVTGRPGCSSMGRSGARGRP